jgi:hypothetical protein
MIEKQEVWKELIRLLSAEGQPTKAIFGTDTYECILHSFSVW